MNRPLACPVIDSPDGAPLPLRFPSNHAELSPPPILFADAVSKPAVYGSSQHGSARIGNARESSGTDRTVAAPQGVATYRGDQTGSAWTAIRCGKSEIGLSSAHEQSRVSTCQDYRLSFRRVRLR